MNKSTEEYESLQNASIKGEAQEVVISTTFAWIVSSIKQAEFHCQAGEFEAMSKPISKAIVLLQGLSEGLVVNPELPESRELATNLNTLYKYSIHKLANGCLEHDIKSIEDAYKVIKELQEGWDETHIKTKK